MKKKETITAYTLSLKRKVWRILTLIPTSSSLIKVASDPIRIPWKEWMSKKNVGLAKCLLFTND